MYLNTLIQELMSKTRLLPAQIFLIHQQKIYVYCLLTFFNNQFTKKILLINFQSRNANTIRAKKQPEDPLIGSEVKNQTY